MKRIKEMAKAMAVIFFAALTAYLAFTHPKDWQTIVIVAIVLFVLIQLFYKPFHIIKLGDKYSLEFDDNTEGPKAKTKPELTSKIDKLSRRLSKTEAKNRDLQDQVNNLNKRIIGMSKSTAKKPELTAHTITTAELFQMFYVTNGLDKFDKTQKPIDVEDFHNTVEEAKKSGNQFEQNYYYKIIVDKYSEAFTYALIKKITLMCDMGLLAKEEQILYKAVKRPYSKATILAVRDELTKDDNNAKLTLEFERFIKKLDMLY